MQVDDIINSAAKEYRVYHYNGGQVFIRLSALDNTMMVIDHSTLDITVELFDGTAYLNAYANYNTEYSNRFIAAPSQLAVLFA